MKTLRVISYLCFTALLLSISSTVSAQIYSSGNTLSATGSSAGTNNTSNGDNTAAFGKDNEVSGLQSGAWGFDNYVTSDRAFAIGRRDTVTGLRGIAMGYANTVKGGGGIAIGSSNDVTSTSGTGVAIGVSHTVTSYHGTALGYVCDVDGDYAIAGGYICEANGSSSVALGHHADANGDNSTALGEWVKANGENSITIGRGHITTELENNIDNSFMVGFNSTVPTFFVGNSTGGSNSTGNVGIGTTSPAEKLEVAGTVRVNSGNDLQRVNIWYDGVQDEAHIDAVEDIGSISGRELILNQSGGRVGIGINTPAAELHVAGRAQIDNELDMNSTRIENVADPAGLQDAATKNYVDGEISNINSQLGNFLTGFSLTTNHLTKWDGSQLVTSEIYEPGSDNVSVGDNNIFSGGAFSSHAVGQDNTIAQGTTNVLGRNNEVLGDDCVVGGTNNFVYDTTERNYVFGEADSVTGNYNILVGNESNIYSSESSSFGIANTIEGRRGVTLGIGIKAMAPEATGVGQQIQIMDSSGMGFGINLLVEGPRAAGFGRFLNPKAEGAYMMGIGLEDFSNLFTNNIPNSLMIGFNSNVPTVFVGSSSGVGTTGDVGIGTSTPRAKLDVNGKTVIGTTQFVGTGTVEPVMLSVDGAIVTKEVFVTNLNWADYVFCDDYKLKSLDEVESFISQNGHLHNTPSQTDIIEKGGVDLMGATVNQQEKIEELYLHVIQLNKRMNSLEQENTQLKAQLNQQ